MLWNYCRGIDHSVVEDVQVESILVIFVVRTIDPVKVA
jgi:hypothetical protein